MEEEKIQQFASDFFRVEEEIGSVIIGQKELVRNVLTAMVAGGNVLLEGMPGLGKTQLVKAVGDAVDLEFSRIQFTPDLMPADVTGTTVMNREENGNMSFVFRKGPIFANLVLADEINRATPKTQSALLEAMQEHTVTGRQPDLPPGRTVFCAGDPEPTGNRRDISSAGSPDGPFSVQAGCSFPQ